MSRNKSVQKRIRQAEKARLRNRHYKSLMRTSISKVRNSENKGDAQELLKTAVSVIDRVTRKGIIHKNNAANKKSRLHKFVAKMS